MENIDHLSTAQRAFETAQTSTRMPEKLALPSEQTDVVKKGNSSEWDLQRELGTRKPADFGSDDLKSK